MGNGPWWVDSKIEATLTRPFVQSHLLADEIAQLDSPVAFGGEDLTERTYWDSIRNDAPRLFLILIDLGVPDQIFPVIDDGFDDAELPIALADVDRLQLTASRDVRMERKFYQRQFHYLLKPLQRGSHIAYADNDVVPLDVVERSSLTPHKSHGVEKVKLPDVPDMIFCRRRYVVGNSPGTMSPTEFRDAVQSIMGLQNDHYISYWASYTHHGAGYVLYTPPCDLTLKSFLATTPSSFKHVPKKNRRELVMNWILCLTDALCYLHSKGRVHGYIKPSTVFLTNQNHIFFCDATRLTPDSLIHHPDKASFDREWYDYAAPEQCFRPSGSSSPPDRFMGPGSPITRSMDDGFNITQDPAMANLANGMYYAPTPPQTPQQADIFSLGCIILELLSSLVKRSTSKFSTYRSAKHKTAGRGGAVLDTSFHRNLGQVESWMSGVAKDASKKISDKDGANMFRGVAPILHVVAGMLSANPYERPPVVEVQKRIYQILTETCGIGEPHCVHQYTAELDYSFGQMRIQANGDAMPGFPRRNPSIGYGTPRSFQHPRSGSSGGYSQTSRTTSSSEADADVILNTGPTRPQQIRPAVAWPRNPAYMGNPHMQQGAPYMNGA